MAMTLNLDVLQNAGSSGAGGNSFAMTNPAAPSQLVGENKPTQNFDVSVLSGLRPSDKFNGNRVSDITDAFNTYISGNPVGRGGKYAADAAKKYGVTITEAARGYLQAAGIPLLGSAVATTNNNGGMSSDNSVVQQLQDTTKQLQQQLTDIQNNFNSNNTVKVLSDQLASLFGNAVYNPPLQSQATGFTPVTTSSPLGGPITSGGSVGLIIILGIVGVIGYFLYKRYAG